MTQDTKIFPLNQQQDGEIIPISSAMEIDSREAEQSLLGGIMHGAFKSHSNPPKSHSQPL